MAEGDTPGSGPTWVVDTSSLIAVTTVVRRADRQRIYQGLGELVNAARLIFPRQVVPELERYQGAENPALAWAKAHQAQACRHKVPLERVGEVLARVADVLDTAKDTGPDEADPYVLALALDLAAPGGDVRIITEEFKTTGDKMSLAAAAGFLALPAVSLRVFLDFERLQAFRAP